MFGPGVYRPDPSEGITATADLPQPEIVPYSRNDTRNVCPRCGPVAYRDKQAHRTLHDLGNLDLWCPRDLVIKYLNKSNFIFLRSASTNYQEGAMKKHMLRYLPIRSMTAPSVAS